MQRWPLFLLPVAAASAAGPFIPSPDDRAAATQTQPWQNQGREPGFAPDTTTLSGLSRAATAMPGAGSSLRRVYDAAVAGAGEHRHLWHGQRLFSDLLASRVVRSL